jgi:virginiamycin A acetyltransferase
MSQNIRISPYTTIYGDFISESPFSTEGSSIIGNVSVGAFSYISIGCIMFHVDIGRYSSIGDHVHILTNHPTSFLSTSPVFYKRQFSEPFVARQIAAYKNILEQTKIGNDVWIGSGVKLKTGIKIGDGSVIGAGSVVTKDVEPFSIVGGTPAKLIRMRFSIEIIERIKSLQWWKYNLLPYQLKWDNLDDTLSQLEHLKNSGELSAYVVPRYKISKEDNNIVINRMNF